MTVTGGRRLRSAGAGLAVAIALALAPGAAAAKAPVLGKKGLMPYGSGWGSAHPAKIFNGGSPGGSVQNIRWRHWGAATATGRGRAPQYRPEGGYYSKLVRVELRATRLGRCTPGGPRAYTRMVARKQTRPGGPFDAWFPWTFDLCNYNAEPAPCPDVPFDAGDGASGIGVWDTGCATARAVVTGAKRVRFDPGPHDRGYRSYSMSSGGFACHGSSFDDSQPPQIGWSCVRGTAVVLFKATVTRDYGPCTDKVVAGVGEALSKCFRMRGRVARSTEPVRINGVDLVPVDRAEIAIDLRRKVLTTHGKVEVRIGRLGLGRHGVRFDLARQSVYKIGTEGAKADLAGLKLTGKAELRLAKGRTVVKASVELPRLVKSRGKRRKDKERPTVEVAFQADNKAGLRPETIAASWPWLRLPGGYELQDVELKYAESVEAEQVVRSFEGSGTLWLRGVNPKGIEAQIKIADGGVFEVSAAAENLNKRIWTVVYLQRLGLTFAVSPFTLGSAVGITAGPQIKLPGQAPFRISRLDGDLTWTNENPDTWKITGKGEFALATFDGDLTVATTGKADLKGDTEFTVPFARRYGVKGHVEGWLEGGGPPAGTGGGGGSWGDGAALLQGRVRMVMPGIDIGKAEAVLSSEGVAACRRGAGPDVGFGYTWGGSFDVMAKSCGLGPWSPARPQASAAQAPGALRLRIPRGRREVALRIDGAGGAPVVSVTGPRGLRIDTPPGDASLDTPKATVIKDAERSVTYIAIERPPGGAYTVTPAVGSPPVAAVSSARPLPRVRVRARVLGRGKHRRLRYRISRLAGARVHFVERGRDARRVIATTRRRRGTARFRPAPGRARARRIEAVVVRGGLVQSRRVVARYRVTRRGR